MSGFLIWKNEVSNIRKNVSNFRKNISKVEFPYQLFPNLEKYLIPRFGNNLSKFGTNISKSINLFSKFGKFLRFSHFRKRIRIFQIWKLNLEIFFPNLVTDLRISLSSHIISNLHSFFYLHNKFTFKLHLLSHGACAKDEKYKNLCAANYTYFASTPIGLF